MNKIRRLLKTIFLGLAIGICSIGLASCASSEEKGTSYDFTCISCSYDSGNDTTLVVWASTITNDSIYNMTEESFKFDLYQGDTFVRTTDYCTYKINIKHGESDVGRRNFTAAGNVTKAELNSWTAKFSSVWDTYKVWFIVTIVVAAIAVVAYGIFVFVEDFDLGNLFEFLSKHFYTIFIIAIPFVPYLISSISSGVWSWVPPLIIGGGLLSIIVVVLGIHLVRFLIELASYGAGGGYVPERKTKDITFNPHEEDIEDYLDDGEALSQFTVSQLREYCRDNGIKGYSTASKGQLVELIMAGEALDDNESQEAKPGSSKKTSSKAKKIKFEDIAGLEEVKKTFREKVIMPFEHPELFEKFGKKAGGGILLYGLPGTGKTMFAEAAANEVDALFIPVKCSDIKSKWYGESEKNVKAIFAKAKKSPKSIIFFDEFEAIGAKRTDSSDNANNDLVPQILAEMQGVGSSSNKSTIVVIAATNKPWAIDSAFMRPGRFDSKIYVPLPDFEARKKIFDLQLSKLPVAEDLDLEYLAKITDGFNGADIKEVCEKLKMSAINDSLEKGEEQTIGMDDIKRIEKNIRSSVSLEDIERLKEFEEGGY